MKKINLEELKLKVNDFETPDVVTNFEIVKKQLQDYLLNFKKNDYTEETIDFAKTDKATLNKLSKTIDSKRKEVKEEYTKPLKEFESKCNELKELVDNQSNEIKTVTDEYDLKLKKIKREECENIFNDRIGKLKDIVSFEKIIDDRWLNKTYSLTAVLSDIETLINKIENGLNAIEEFNSEFELEIKSNFLEDYDISKAIFRNTQLIKQKEIMLEISNKKIESASNNIKKGVEIIETNKKDTSEKMVTYVLKITMAISKKGLLKDFLTDNDISFEQVD